MLSSEGVRRYSLPKMSTTALQNLSKQIFAFVLDKLNDLSTASEAMLYAIIQNAAVNLSKADIPIFPQASSFC